MSVTILIIPPIPSASYLAPGSVITSTSFTLLAGILFSTCEGLFETILDGFPLMYILKFEEPLSWISSSPSTVTSGTFRNKSSTLDVDDSGSSFAL